MTAPLDRLRKLTLAMEAALAENDLSAFGALLEARGDELAKLPAGAYADADEIERLDARLQAVAGQRMECLRSRMRQLAHVTRTARAVRAAQESARRVDVSG